MRHSTAVHFSKPLKCYASTVGSRGKKWLTPFHLGEKKRLVSKGKEKLSLPF